MNVKTDARQEAARRYHEALKEFNLEYSALSWNGFNLFGDRDSVNEVHRLLFVESRVAALEAALKSRDSK